MAKAEAAEALADALDSTEDAIEARNAATKARKAADDATTAATEARSAADDATEAATNAREAATKAQGAAKRAQAAADDAKADVKVTEAAVKKAHAAAADAIAASAAAKWNAITAKAEAEAAQKAATKARGDATVARSEAGLAGADSIRAAGHAYATAQAATAARDSAARVVQPANDAIELGSPYAETDSSAGLAVLTGQASKTAAEQQAALAKAKAAQAAQAAAEAKVLAAKADADAKAAAEAAANAADYASQAAGSAADAQASSAAADASAKAAKKSEADTVEYDKQAKADAEAAQEAATSADGYATQADVEADDAERDAASARSAADGAEKDATTAEDAAAHARDLAVEAAKDAIRTQQAGFEDTEERGRTADGGGTDVDGVVMRPSGDTLVDIDPQSDCVGTHSGADAGCEIDLKYHVYGEMDFYLETCSLPGVDRSKCGAGLKRDYLTSVPLDVTFEEKQAHVDGYQLTEQILKSIAMAAVSDIVGCWKGRIGSCLWLAGSIVLPGLLGKMAEAAIAVRMAVRDGTRISTALWGLRGSGLAASAIAQLEKLGGRALLSKCFPAGTKVATADGPKPIEDIRVGDRVWSQDQATGRKSLQPVLKLFHRTVSSLVRIRTADGQVEATGSHRFWVRERGWVEAGALRSGDTLESRDGASKQVLDTTVVKGSAGVFNFEVARNRTYYVYAGSTPVLVHNDCLTEIVKDLVKNGDHIVLGINPYSDSLAETTLGGTGGLSGAGARTFNNKVLGRPFPDGDGRPIWMVAVENALDNQSVKLSVSLDGVPDAKTAAEALNELVERGKPLLGGDWQTVATPGSNNGTAWEMATLRLKVILGRRSFDDIDWYFTKPGERVPSLIKDMPRPDWAE